MFYDNQMTKRLGKYRYKLWNLLYNNGIFCDNYHDDVRDFLKPSADTIFNPKDYTHYAHSLESRSCMYIVMQSQKKGQEK